MVFDNNGNLLYTKTKYKPKEEIKFLQTVMLGDQEASDKLKNQMNNRYNKSRPNQMVSNIMKNTEENLNIHPRKRAMMEVKSKSMKSLMNKMLVESKEMFIEQCRQEINQVERLMSTELDK